MDKLLKIVCDFFDNYNGGVEIIYNIELKDGSSICLIKCLNNSYFEFEYDKMQLDKFKLNRVDIFELIEEKNIDIKNDMTKIYDISYNRRK